MTWYAFDYIGPILCLAAMAIVCSDAYSRASIRRRKRPVVITGPSGVGKSTMADLLMQRYPKTFTHCITHTTRPPRVNERDGVAYHFTTRTRMEQQIARGEFIEHADVYGHLYGISRMALEKAAETGTPLLVLDVQGADTVRHSGVDAVFLCILPPSTIDLRTRLVRRGTDTTAMIDKRMRTADGEIDTILKWRDNHIVNDDITRCFQMVQWILETAGVVEKLE